MDRSNWKGLLVGGLVAACGGVPVVVAVTYLVGWNAPPVSAAAAATLLGTLRAAAVPAMIPWWTAFFILGGLIGISIAAARKSAGECRAGEERFRIMADAAQDAIVLMDARGVISFWNRAAERIFGYARSEVLGRDLHSLLAPERYHSAARERIEKFWQTGPGADLDRTLEVEALKRDGSEFPIELSLSAVEIEGDIQAIGIIRDISLRKEAEQERIQKEKLQGVLEMAGAACHELNQPLQIITGYSEILRDQFGQPEPDIEVLDKVLEEVRRMAGITHKIMRVTRYETRDYVGGIRIIDIEKASTAE